MKSSNSNRNMIWIILFSSTLTVMAGAIIGPVVREISVGLEVDPSAAGQIITMHGIFVFLLSPLIGSLIDRIGSKRPYVFGLILYGLAGGAGLVIESFPLLLLSRAILGVAVALIFTSVMVMILNLYEGKEKQRVMGLRGSANSLGAAIWPLVGGALGTISWHLPFGVYLVAIPLAPLSLIFIPEVKRVRKETNAYSIVSIFKKSPVLFGIYGLMLLTNLLLYVNVVFLPQVLADIDITTTFQVGLFLAMMGASAGITASQYEKIRERFSYQTLVVLSFLFWSIGFCLVFFTSSPWTYGLSVTLFGIGQGLMLPTVMLWIGDVVTSTFLGRFSSYLTTFGYLGQFLAPIVFAPVSQSLGISEIFLIASFVSACGFIASLLNLLKP